MEYSILLLSIIILILTDKINCVNWDYDKLGPDVWSKYYPDCGKHSQSPVNIRTACTIQKDFQPFQFTSIYNDTLNFTLTNDGHTITVRHNGHILPLSGGNLDGNYRFVNFHVHWGPNEKVGSEHQINGEKYMGETHFVFENVQTGKFAVLGFFMESRISSESQIHDRTENATMDQWRHFFDTSQMLIKENDSITIDLNLSLLMGNHFKDFWRYNGSLTIPPCTEDVIWTVFKEPIQIFDYHFETFRDDLLFDSYRGPQPLYYRNIFRSFKNEILSSIPDQNCCINIKSKANSLSIITILHLVLTIFLSF